MSAIDHYLAKGYKAQNRNQTIQEGAAVKVWNPTTSTRIVITDVCISVNDPNTIAFYWGSAGDKIAEFLLAGSATITPSIGVWEGTAYDRPLYARTKLGETDGVRISLTGVEIPFF